MTLATYFNASCRASSCLRTAFGGLASSRLYCFAAFFSIARVAKISSNTLGSTPRKTLSETNIDPVGRQYALSVDFAKFEPESDFTCCFKVYAVCGSG